MPNAQEKVNLARIRDNQRRSRARRKEYLQEVEARLRQCELHGIEASAEIQIAARKVADENRKLRALLMQRGVAEGDIEACLQNNEHGGVAVQNLEYLLATRKVVCATRCAITPTSERSAESHRSSVSARIVQPSRNQQGHQQRSSNEVNMESGVAHSIRSEAGCKPGVSMDKQSPCSGAVPDSMPTVPTRSSKNYNNCTVAVDMITTMSGADPQTVRSELGCMPDTDCEVDNQLVFNVMDRYTG